jgi:hypothetical protein
MHVLHIDIILMVNRGYTGLKRKCHASELGSVIADIVT